MPFCLLGYLMHVWKHFCSFPPTALLSDEGRADVCGRKAAHFFSLAESLRSPLVDPFIWVFIRPPWSATGSCCKAVVFDHLKVECEKNMVSSTSLSLLHINCCSVWHRPLLISQQWLSLSHMLNILLQPNTILQLKGKRGLIHLKHLICIQTLLRQKILLRFNLSVMQGLRCPLEMFRRRWKEVKKGGWDAHLVGISTPFVTWLIYRLFFKLSGRHILGGGLWQK